MLWRIVEIKEEHNMVLDERSAALLQNLQQVKSLTMAELEEKTSLTRRQVQYGMKKANDWLEAHGYEPIQFDRKVGYYLIASLPVKDLQAKLTKQSYVFSESDREQVFYLMLLLSEEELSVYHFQSAVGVSRNTVLKDLQKLKKKAKSYGLDIHYSKVKGYVIKGEHESKLYLLEQIIHELLQNGSSQPVVTCIWGTKQAQLEHIQSELEAAEHQLGVSFTDERLDELSFLFLALDQLICKGDTLPYQESWRPLVETNEYKVVEALTYSQTFSPDWSKDDKLYATLHLLGMNRTKDVSPFQENELIETCLLSVIDEFERLSCIELQEKEELYQQLFVHFKPAYYRMKYQLTPAHTMVERIKNVYPELYHLTNKSLGPMRKELDCLIPESEVAYFTVYFGGWLRKQGTTLDGRKRAIVVCPNGVGISNILIYTLRELFPDLLFLDALSVREMSTYSLSYDLIFSTVHLRTNALLFVVPPILGIEDKEKLKQHVMQELYGYTSNQVNLEAVMKVIESYATIHQRKELQSALQSQLQTHVQKTTKYSLEEVEKPVLKELLTAETIQLQPSVSSWQESIEEAAAPLLKIGAIEKSYVEAMVTSIEETGPYVVITPGVAIPHARPEHGVRSLSMSLLKLDEPVDFGGNKLVQIIIVLAATDNESHLKALVQLTQLLGEPSNIEDIIASSSVEHILTYINQYSEEEM